MKIITWVQEGEVWNYWRKAENKASGITNWQNNVKEKLPYIVAWFQSKVEKDDIKNIFVISSEEWKGITPTFKLVDTVQSLDKPRKNALVRNILEKRKTYENDLNCLDRMFILVSPTIKGNFTIIEGNKRASALLSIKKFVGSQVYLGISPKIREYYWARYTPVA